ncbi:hypothetical protein [Amycolatopsis arida]|uniref:hypothetical protein n=1 Tax=Amycolatopsis arida TaxID=587909 RepID=UPI001066AAB0|nr:hypothetical protein [Amycolatopsis arida]
MDLSELIYMVKERDGLSWRELTDRARKKGAPVPTGLFYLANKPLQDFPRTKTILGLAAALEVDPDVVAAAALESLGLRPRNEVEVQVKQARVHKGDTGPELQGQPGERWIMITPDDETSDDLLDYLQKAPDLRVVVRKDPGVSPDEVA